MTGTLCGWCIDRKHDNCINTRTNPLGIHCNCNNNQHQEKK